MPAGDRVTLSRLCLASGSLYHFAAPRLYRSLYLNFEGVENSGLCLLNTLLRPGYDARWKKWIKSVNVTALKNPVGIHGRQDVCGSLAKVLNRIECGSLDKFRFVCFFLLLLSGVGWGGFQGIHGKLSQVVNRHAPSLGLI